MPGRNSVVPTLELVSPNLPGRLYELESETVRIGRDPASDIVIDLRQVSWAHARVVRRPDGAFLVEDLDSYNHTYLEGKRLHARMPTLLKDGCRIRILDVTLIFRQHAIEVLEEGCEGATILGSLEDLSALGLSSRTERAATVLQAVLEINRILGGTADLNEVLGRALTELFSIFSQAECGFILTREPDGKLSPRATRHREGATDPPALSRTVLNHVMTECKALLIADAKTDPTFKGTDTLRGAGIRTAMCVPIPGRDGSPIGIVQLDSRSQTAKFNTEDLELLAAVSIPIGVVVENHRLLKLSASLAAAAEVQAALLPRARPSVPGYSFWEHYQPALEVGGDYYDYIPIEPPEASESDAWLRWAVALGDVSGKGMPAALLMANLCAEVRHLVRAGIEARQVTERVNRRVFDAGLASRFITFLLVSVDARTHRLVVVNAGHNELLIRRRDGTIEALSLAAGMPLGVLREETYESVETDIECGDVVVLYTDGVTEAMNRNDELFGKAALKKAIASAPPGPAKIGDSIIRAVRSHAGTRPQSDDIAVVCFGRD